MTNQNIRKHGWETRLEALEDTADFDINTVEQTWLNDGFTHSDFSELWTGWSEAETDLKTA